MLSEKRSHTFVPEICLVTGRNFDQWIYYRETSGDKVLTWIYPNVLSVVPTK